MVTMFLTWLWFFLAFYMLLSAVNRWFIRRAEAREIEAIRDLWNSERGLR